MAEYIEREALIAEYDRVHVGTAGGARKLMVDAPSADVVPVVRGHWEFDGSDWSDIWKCSACGDEWFFEYDPRDAETLVKFCPNCGARMDGE